MQGSERAEAPGDSSRAALLGRVVSELRRAQREVEAVAGRLDELARAHDDGAALLASVLHAVGAAVVELDDHDRIVAWTGDLASVATDGVDGPWVGMALQGVGPVELLPLGSAASPGARRVLALRCRSEAR